MALAKKRRYNQPTSIKNALLSRCRVLLFVVSCITIAIYQQLLQSYEANALNKNTSGTVSSAPNQTIYIPPTINIYNVSNLSFNESKMTLNGAYREYILPNVSYAYGPYITKSGSSSMKTILQRAIGADKYAKTLSIETMSDEELDQYHFVTFLRHPMERALAGFHEVELFWRNDWINGPIDDRQLRWWNITCLNSTWSREGSKEESQSQVNPCRGSVRKTTTERRLQRLHDFLDEIDGKVGFWDQHIAPTTYLLAINKLTQRAKYYDIKHLNDVAAIIAKSVGKNKLPIQKENQRGGLDSGMDWVLRWNELVDLTPKYPLARSAVEKLCRLYQNDVVCLPYDVPKCKGRA